MTPDSHFIKLILWKKGNKMSELEEKNEEIQKLKEEIQEWKERFSERIIDRKAIIQKSLEGVPPYKPGMSPREILKHTIKIIMVEAQYTIQEVKNELVKKGVLWDEVYSRKFISESFSGITSQSAAYVLTIYCGFPVLASKNDNDCDVFFTLTNQKLEVKVSYAATNTSLGWRGGKGSKREGDFLLISRLGDNFKQFYAAHLMIEKSEWIFSKKDNCWITTFPKDSLLKHERLELLGKCSDDGKVERVEI